MRVVVVVMYMVLGVVLGVAGAPLEVLGPMKKYNIALRGPCQWWALGIVLTFGAPGWWWWWCTGWWG